MSKDSVFDWDVVAANNTDIGGIDITGTTGRVKDGDNAVRTVMSQIATRDKRDVVNVEDYILGSDTYDSTGILRAIDAAETSGKSLQSWRRDYTIGEVLVLPDGLRWFGGDANLMLQDGINSRIIEAIAATAGTITGELHDLNLYGNKDNQTGTSEGIYIEGGYRYNMYGVLVDRAKGDGIEYALGAASGSFENYIFDSQVYRCDGFCVRGTGAVTDTHVFGGDYGASKLGGISLATSWSVKGATIWGGGVSDAGAPGVQTGGPNNKILDNQIEGWGGHGVLDNADNSFTQIRGNSIYANSWGTDGTYDGINVAGGASVKGTQISGNKIYSAVTGSSGIMRRAITLGTHTNFVITGNDMRYAKAVAAIDISADLVTGVGSTDVTDYSWIKTRVFEGLSADQTGITGATWTTVAFATETTDTESEFDTSTYTWTCKQSGRYRIRVALYVTPGAATAGQIMVRTTKNGSEHRRLDAKYTAATTSQMVGGMTIENYAAGDALTVEVWISPGGSVLAGAAITYLQIETAAN